MYVKFFWTCPPKQTINNGLFHKKPYIMYKKVNNEIVTLSFHTFKKRKIVKTCKEFHVLMVKEEATGNIA